MLREGVALKSLRSAWWSVEGPTWVLAAAIYGGWALLTLYHDLIPAPLWLLAMAWLLAWHGSLQHEAIHGHPGGGKIAAALLGYPPLGLWLPFPIYRVTHLQHHNDTRLTDPYDDPESYYASRRRWLRLPRFWRRLLIANHTLTGRILVGPAIVFATFYWREAHRVGDARRRRAWTRHALAVAGVLLWLAAIGMPAWQYVVAVYAATSLILIRSYYEHRAAIDPAARTAVVEGVFPFGLLFLFNNLHAAHHAQPKLAWYLLPAFYRANRAGIAAANGGFVFSGYGELFRRYLLRPNYLPVHPWA
jgi:fatty acid desaturase